MMVFKGVYKHLNEWICLLTLLASYHGATYNNVMMDDVLLLFPLEQKLWNAHF